MIQNLQQVEPPETAEFIGEEELRRRLGVSRRTIFGWRESAKLPFVRIPGSRLIRYHWPTIQNFLLRQQRNTE
jgi:hypothetical protein